MVRRRMLLENDGLPSTYQQVEWVQSLKDEYIDTGLYLTSEAEVEIIFNGRATDRTGNPDYPNWGGIFGAFNNSNSFGKRFATSLTYNKAYLYFGSYNVQGNPSSDISFTTGNNKIKISKTGLYYNDVLQFSLTDPTEEFVCDCTSEIFGQNSFVKGAGYFTGGAKLVSLKITDGNVRRNFVPCYRKSDNEIGMFDTITQTFYTNQGTGAFTKGPDVLSGGGRKHLRLKRIISSLFKGVKL